MLFEFSIAKKYLIPKKKQLSLSLIAFLSVGVISLVVWLILVFLSVTDGIEKNWLKKLTSFNAAIQITPTDAYYQSYYYQVDSLSSKSDFNTKSIKEKATSLLTDPYNPDEDLPIPPFWPDKDALADGSTKDLVKLAFEKINHVKTPLIAQDYEVSGALLKLRMIRFQNPSFAPEGAPVQSYLTQASYINSFSNKSPSIYKLIDPPRIEDLNHLIFLTEIALEEPLADQISQVRKNGTLAVMEHLAGIFQNIKLKQVKSSGKNASFLLKLLPENTKFEVIAHKKNGLISYVVFSSEERKKSPYFEKGTLIRKDDQFTFISKDNEKTQLGLSIPLFLEQPLTMQAKLLPLNNWLTITCLRDVQIEVQLTLQGQMLRGVIPWEGIEIEKATPLTTFQKEPSTPPPWVYQVGNVSFLPKIRPGTSSALLPKSFQVNGAKIGDSGYFAYNAATSSTIQEQRLPVHIAGFYDPGVMAIGARMILTDPDTVHLINTSSQTFSIDQNMKNGIQVWTTHLKEIPQVQKELVEAFEEANILPYWKITPYYEYDFAKDLLQQFQSDKYLFTLIGIIILIVACSNIISLLVILVNDKKKEIAILSAMGASKKSTVLIFTLCGGLMGAFSTLLGVSAALFTVHHIDVVVQFLSFIQGHEAFNAVFYGKSLPNELSERALTFILIATPIISLFAGLVPAIKASKVHPSKVLRSE